MEETTTLQPTETSNDVRLTEKAVAEVKKLMEENKIPSDFGLRVGVKGGGCSGLTYTLGFDNDTKDGDKIEDIDGVKLMVDWKSVLYLSGTVVDYTDGLNGKGFVFNNPAAKKTCGCGSSFGV